MSEERAQPPVRQLGTRVAYRNPWMVVREDDIALANGSTGIYGVIEKQDFALVVPRENDGFWLVEQYRYTIGRRAWEFPQGGWPEEPEGGSDALANKELREETGLTAGKMVLLGNLFAAYGFCSQAFDVFLATDLVHGQPQREATEQDMVHKFVTDAELIEMVNSGQIVDAATLAAYSMLTFWDRGELHR